MSDYNFKVKCVDIGINIGTYDEGGIYEVKNGTLSTNGSHGFKGHNQRLGFRNIDEVNDWSSSKFEEVFDEEIKEDKKMNKFKVGDKVRIIGNKSGHCFNIGEIVELYEDCGGDFRGRTSKNETLGNHIWYEDMKLNRDYMIEKLDEYCGEHSCNDCVFEGECDEFDDMTDEELLSSYNLANLEFATSKTFTITTSDTTTTITDGTHTTTINRYYTDKHDDMVALEEVVKKYKSEMEEIERKSKEMHLMMGKNDYGVIGTPTVLVDSIGRKLSVGDVVKVYDKNGEYINTEFVCNCSSYGDFIMGCAISTMNNSKEEFNYLKEFSYEETVEKSLSFSGLEVIK